MPVSCCAVDCANRFSKDSRVTFHRFPEDARRRELWIKAVSRDKWELKTHHRLCSEHFVSGRPSKDPEDVDYVPTIFKDAKRRWIFTTTPGRAERAQKRARNAEEAEEAASILMDLSDSFASRTDRESRFCEAGTNTDLSFFALLEELSMLRMQNQELKEKLLKLETEREVSSVSWGMQNIAGNDRKVKFYTGMPNYQVLMALLAYIKRLSDAVTDTHIAPGPGRPKSLKIEDEFLAVLMRLRLGLLVEDVSERFGVSVDTYSRIFAKWIKLLSRELRLLFPWPTQEAISARLPVQFAKYPRTRVIIDCTEIFIQRPSSLQSQLLTFSSYKHHNTFKVLVGISPGGVVTFVSQLWGGRVSDRLLTERSGIIKLLQPGDNVMADRGFDIQDVLAPLGVTINIPPFMDQKPQLSAKEVTETRRIAEVRIHVERAIGRIKNYRILQGILPITLAANASEIFAVCAYLTNFSPPVVQ